MIVFAEDAAAFASAQQEEITEKTTVYDDPSERINENGFVEIPITDPEHLKKIVITGDVSSSGGSSWATAGCAVGINAVTPDGTKFWTSKGYSLKLGSGSSAVIEFDGTLQTEDKEDVPAVVADGKIELQQWWSASEKQEAELEDEITVRYTKIEVVYAYPADSPGSSVQGDLDGDGKLTKADAAVLQKHLLTEKSLTAAQAALADFNGDKQISASDLTLLKRALMK